MEPQYIKQMKLELVQLKWGNSLDVGGFNPDSARYWLCVGLNKLLYLSEIQFLHLDHDDSKGIYFTKLLLR